MQDLLSRYKGMEFSVVTELTRLTDISRDLGNTQAEAALLDSVNLVRQKNFNVIVVGEFNRGKSSLINALLKMEVLPSDMLPTTATINRVAYSPKPAARVFFKNKTEREIDIHAISEYVTKLTPQGESVARTIEETVIEYPAPFCSNNITIVDTPGLCDNEEMTRITMNAIGKADAAIMVISACMPFSQT